MFNFLKQKQNYTPTYFLVTVSFVPTKKGVRLTTSQKHKGIEISNHRLQFTMLVVNPLKIREKVDAHLRTIKPDAHNIHITDMIKL